MRPQDFAQFQVAVPSDDTDEIQLYAPYDRVHEAFLAAADSVAAQLILAMFGFTDPAIWDVIGQKLANPKIHCQLTLDELQSKGKTESALIEKYAKSELGNQVAIGTSEHGAYMHRKMWIVDQSLLLTGSTNLSLDAEQKQDNQLLISSRPSAIARANIILGLEHAKALGQKNPTAQ